MTGAPRSFVHVLITEDSRNKLTDGENGVVSGTIRAARSEDQRSEIIAEVSAALSTRAAVNVASISMTSQDIQASYTMEGGALLPEPGSRVEATCKTLA